MLLSTEGVLPEGLQQDLIVRALPLAGRLLIVQKKIAELPKRREEPLPTIRKAPENTPADISRTQVTLHQSRRLHP